MAPRHGTPARPCSGEAVRVSAGPGGQHEREVASGHTDSGVLAEATGFAWQTARAHAFRSLVGAPQA